MSPSKIEQSRALPCAPAPVQITVVGFSEERAATASFSCSPQRTLPESPLARLIKAQNSRQLPRLKIKTKVGAEESPCTSNGLSVPPRRIVGSAHAEDTSGRASQASSLSRSSDPISIPETCRSHRSLSVEGQILEDLSLDANALCMLRFSPSARVAGGQTLTSHASFGIGQNSVSQQTIATSLSLEIETLALAQLRDLESHAKQGNDELHMVSLVESMRLAAEEHDRLLLECALLKARRISYDDCIFDLDLNGTCSAGPALTGVQRRCITA